MSGESPSFEEFQVQLETLFGQPLTPQAVTAARDFWQSWSGFGGLIAARSLSVHVDALRLGRNLPQYRRYHVWKGAGTVLLVVGLLVLWFVWQIGVLLMVLGVGTHFWSNRIRFSDAQQFAESLMREATLNARAGGYAGLCCHYIAGTISLVSPKGSAHWPQHPSNVISGARSLISTQ